MDAKIIYCPAGGKFVYILYFLLWVIFNGRFTLEIGIFGLVIAGMVFAFTCKFSDYSLKQELHNYKNIFLFLQFTFLLIKEIIKANINVIHMILTQKEEIEPVLVTFHSDLKTAAGKAFFGNAITLTPGTITVSLEGSEYTVHCLDESMAQGINNNKFLDLIKNMEK